jgi:hypothetical protein
VAEDVRPQIQASEIADWEKKFKENVSPLVKFDTQGDNGTSFKIYKGSSGIEVEWSGEVILGSDDYIKWKFTILNDAFIDSKFKLDEDTRDLIKKIFDLYESWSKEWSQSVSKLKSQPAQLKESRSKESIIRFSKDRMTRLAGLK